MTRPAQREVVENDARFDSQSVPAAFAGALLTRAGDCGLDVEAIVHAARLPFDPQQPRTPLASLSPGQYSRLCVALLRALGDESGGILSDARTPPGTLRLIGLSMVNSATLQAALRRGIEFNRVCRVQGGKAVHNTVAVNGRCKEAVLTYLDPGECPGAQHKVVCGMAIWLRFCSWLIGQPIDVTRAGCAGPRPTLTAGIRHFHACPVSYDEPVNSLTFSARHLDAPIVRDEEQLDSFLALAPYYLLIAPAVGGHSVSQRIREILGEDFRQEMPAFGALTTLLNMSARTLRRRLEKEGTSYQRIKDTARRDVAIGLLAREGLTVSDVAELTGFSDASAFHRSFKKWTGLSPGSYHPASAPSGS